MICKACTFDTDRMLVREWHSVSPGDWPRQDLAALVVDLMTQPVTRSLPPPWQGEYSLDRATRWVAERDSEGATLIIIERSTNQAVGLMILFESPLEDGNDGVDVRLGYLLAESAWGKGFASELIEGFVRWCRDEATIESVAGGVGPDNPASARVLEKNGFRPLADERQDGDDERIYELKTRR